MLRTINNSLIFRFPKTVSFTDFDKDFELIFVNNNNKSFCRFYLMQKVLINKFVLRIHFVHPAYITVWLLKKHLLANISQWHCMLQYVSSNSIER